MRFILSVMMTAAVLPAADEDVPADSSVIWLDEVVTVASRIERQFRDITQAVTVLPAARLAELSENDANAVFLQEPGTSVRSYGSLKGLSSLSIWGAGSQQVLMTLDGHPLVNPLFGGPDLGLVSLGGLARAEIVRGAGSSFYGPNALGGTVNFVSATPWDLPADRVLRHEMRAALGAPVTTGLAYRLTGRYAPWGFSAGLEQDAAAGVRSNSASQNYGVSARVCGQHQDLEVTAGLTSTSRELGLPGPLPDTGPTPRWGDSTATSLFDRENDRTTMIHADLNWAPCLWPGVRTRLVLKPDLTLARTSFRTLSPYALYPTDFKHDNYDSRSAGTMALVSVEPDFGKAVLGYDLRQDRAEVCSEVSDTTWQGRNLNHGVWLEALVRLPAGLSADAGARLDVNQDYGTALSPSAGIAWTGLPGLKLRANWGLAFRAPSLTDRYWPVSGVKDLKPEHGMVAQAGADIDMPDARFRPQLSVTGFMRQTRDQIVWLPDSGGFWRPHNVDRSRHVGVEFGGRLAPLSGLDVRLNATWLSATQTRLELAYYDFLTGEVRFAEVTRKAAFVPGLSCGAELGYRFGLGTQLSVAGRFRSERVNYYQEYNSDNTVSTVNKRLAPCLIFDAGVGHTFFEHLRLSLRGTNLLDARYAEQFGNTLQDRDYPMPGRSVTLVLAYETR